MNADVDEPVERPESRPEFRQTDSSTIFSRLRNLNFNNLAIISLGSFFTSNSTTNSACSESFPSATSSEPALNTTKFYSNNHEYPYTTLTPTPSRPSTPQNFVNGRMSFARPTSAQSMGSPIPPPRMTASSSSSYDYTPPLTPDSLGGITGSSSETSQFSLDPLFSTYFHQENEMDENSARRHSREIREGKRPERPEFYDPEIERIPSEDGNYDAEIPDAPISDVINSPSSPDDPAEWYGLEYTLQLSTRERQFSSSSSAYSHPDSVGEHSKSRESWLALHHGTIHPYYEEEEFYRWTNWHRYLERQEHYRKHRKGFAFKNRSKEQAWVYLDEMRTRGVMYWQMETYGFFAPEVEERLFLLAGHREEPYYPQKRHDLGWYLKRSRSVACLRELKAHPSSPPVARRQNTIC